MVWFILQYLWKTLPSSWFSSCGDSKRRKCYCQASGSKQETCNFPYRSGTGGVQVNFTDVVQILKKHYNRKRFEIAQSFNFCSWNQKFEESGIDYVLWWTLESGIMRMIYMWTDQCEDTGQTIEHGWPMHGWPAVIGASCCGVPACWRS